MNYGQGISFTSKTISGAPFPAGSAENGTSISTGSGNTPIGKIQLGNNLGDPQTGQLLDNVEIPLNLNIIRITDNAAVPSFFIQFSSNSGVSVIGPLGLDNNASGSMQPGNISVICVDAAVPPFIHLEHVLPANGIDIQNLAGVIRFTFNAVPSHLISLSDIQSHGTFTTGQPSANGPGSWKLGKILAGAVALDAGNYIEVMVDGVVKKLLIAA